MATAAIDVYIKLPTGRTITLHLLPSETVGEICRQIAKDEGVLEARVRVKYQGKVLKKPDTVKYLGICTETILKADIITLKRLNIFIKISGGRVAPFAIDNVTTVQELKQQIKEKEDIDTARQVLKLGGRILGKGTEAAADVGITDEAVLDLEVTEVKAKSENSTEEAEETNQEEIEQQVLSSFDAGGRNVEVVFSFDTTGSMYSCLSEVRAKVTDTTKRLLRDIPGIRIGIIAHGDYCDHQLYVVKVKDFTSDVDELVEFVNNVPKTSGGDSPECYEWALRKAQQLDWAEDSAKALVMIGDCEPHEITYTDQRINWHDELDLLKAMGVKVYGVQAMNNTSVTPFYKELAEQTGGAHLQFQHFSIITDMFLAVCYKEASPEQLQAYCEEVEQEGRMTEEAKEMFVELERAPPEPEEERPRRYVASHWWDPDLCDPTCRPKYKYDLQMDQWYSYGSTPKPPWARVSPPMESPPESTRPTGTRRSLRSRFTLRKKKSPKTDDTRSSKCTVM